MALDEQRKERQIPSVKKSLRKRLEEMEGGLPNEEARERYQEIINNTAPFEFTPSDIEMLNDQVMAEMREEKEAAFQKERAEILAKRPEQEAANPLGARTGRATMKDGGPGIDALRKVAPEVVKTMGYNKGGDVKDQMNALAISVEPVAVTEEPMLPDEEMEEDYVDYVVQETLSNQDRNYLIDALEKDDKLSEIFDQVVESATEFTGSGTVNGPGTGKSDSIPARLSDGEFVFTAKATEEIGSDNLMSMMKDAEAASDQRQKAYNGGPIREEKEAMAVSQEPVQQEINVTKTTLDSSLAMQMQDEDPVRKAVKENMMLDPYQKHVRS